MTEKELLYVEDAIGHLKMMKKKCERYETMVTDQNLKRVICNLKTKQENLYSRLYNLL